MSVLPGRWSASVTICPCVYVVQNISNLRARLSKAADDQGIVASTPGSVNLVSTRLRMVLHVYLPADQRDTWP